MLNFSYLVIFSFNYHVSLGISVYVIVMFKLESVSFCQTKLTNKAKYSIGHVFAGREKPEIISHTLGGTPVLTPTFSD